MTAFFAAHSRDSAAESTAFFTSQFCGSMAQTVAPAAMPRPRVKRKHAVFIVYSTSGKRMCEIAANMREKGILVNGLEDGKYRFVTHYWVGKKEIDRVADTLAQILA